MLKRIARKMRDERGITGLETAIILIAFVVVASVFAYTVLSAGIFSSQKGQEAVYAGLTEARSTLQLNGSVVGKADGSGANANMTHLVFTVSSALKGIAIDLTPPENEGGLAADGSLNVTVISYFSQNIRTDDLAWSIQPLGMADDDNLLEAGELFEITVDLTGVGENIGPYRTFTIEVKPPVGSILPIQRTTPASLEPVMILN